MKTRLFAFFVFPAALLTSAALTGCSNPALSSALVPEFPRPPESWLEVLGEPSWELEWYGRNGNRLSANASGGVPVMDIFREWPSPVTARPFWPEKGIGPGMFRPAGAIFPFDAGGGVLRLSWKGGVDAAFYQALEEAHPGVESANPVRRGRFFDWRRFRALLSAGAPAEVREDPWRVDWKAAAEKTAASGFRASYLKARDSSPAAVVIPHNGPWFSASPFREAENWAAGDTVLAPLPTGSELPGESELWACPGGLLFLSADASLWTPYAAPAFLRN
ncbi:MAG: hypothetical protein LBI67_09655 [Treponema sp.]|jgi:hypothetical protein|nr:hypothetical protein [Treponema sp.]